MAILKVGGTQIASSSGSDVTLDNVALGSSVTGLPSAGFKHLATVTAADTAVAASFDGFYTSDYTHYTVMWHDVKCTHNNAGMQFRVRQSNADLATGSGYQHISDGRNYGSEDSVSYNQNTDYAKIGATDSASSSTYKHSGELTLYAPFTSGTIKYMGGHTMGYNSGSPPTAFRSYRTGIWYVGNTNALSGFSFYFDQTTANTISGTFQLFGIKNS